MTRIRLVIVSLAVIVAGTGATLTVTQTRATVDAGNMVAKTQRFLAALPLRSIDYDPAFGPAELAARSDIVAIGRIVAFRAGRYYAGNYEDDDAAMRTHTAVMEFEVARIIAGKLPDPNHHSLYVEFWLDNVMTAASLNSTAPKRASVLVYATAVAADPLYENLIHDAASGRPTGQPLMQFATPQGFLIDTGDRIFRALQPSQPLTDPGIRLSDLMPPNEVFPPELQN